MVIVFSWKSNFTPRSCIVCLPIMRSYIGAWSMGYTLQCLAEGRPSCWPSTQIAMSPILSVMKVPLEVPHN